MPKKPAKTRAHRELRCTYQEGARRCAKDGEGNPPLCRTHQIAVAAILNQQDRSPAQRLVDLASDLLSGKRINQADMMGVVQEVADQWSGMAGGYRPPVSQDGRTAHNEQPKWTPEAWVEFLRRQGMRGQRQPPPPHPEQEQVHVERIRARKTLGFTNSEVLTETAIKQRQKQLARKHHPDLGGSTAKMAGVNAAADVLLASLEMG